MTNKLKDLFDLINSWLKFAEAKNGVLVAFSGSTIWGIVRILFSEYEISFVGSLYLSQLLLFLVLGFLYGLIAFLPITNYIILMPTGETSKDDNLLLYSHIAKYRKKEFIDAFCIATNKEVNEIDKVDEMYVEQIIINSRITTSKYQYFTNGIRFVILGIFTPIIGYAILYFVNNHKRKIVHGI